MRYPNSATSLSASYAVSGVGLYCSVRLYHSTSGTEVAWLDTSAGSTDAACVCTTAPAVPVFRKDLGPRGQRSLVLLPYAYDDRWCGTDGSMVYAYADRWCGTDGRYDGTRYGTVLLNTDLSTKYRLSLQSRYHTPIPIARAVLT